jgi:hypothetical protein
MKKILLILSIVSILLIAGCVSPTIDSQIKETEPVEEVAVEPVEEKECSFDFECDSNECINEKCTIVEEEEPSETIIEDTVEETPIVEEINNGPFKIKKGETIDVLGKSLTVDDIIQPNYLYITIDGEEGELQGTQNEEIINELRITVTDFDFKRTDRVNDYVTLDIEELELGINQYLMEKQDRITIGNKDIVFEESKKTGHISVSVFDTGTIKGYSDEIIKSGATETINGLKITNLENYYTTKYYAIVEVVTA